MFDDASKFINKAKQAAQDAGSALNDAGKKAADKAAQTAKDGAAAAQAAAAAAAAAAADAAKHAGAFGRAAADEAQTARKRIAQAGDAIVMRGRLESAVSTRSLRQNEIDLARSVFGDSLPYPKIVLSSDDGLSNRQYTTAEPNGTFTVHCGNRMFQDVTRTDVAGFSDSKGHAVMSDSMIIHELTHVWQGKWWDFPTQYEFNSVFNQTVHCFDINGAYQYENGGTWSHYSAEQQAMIVQDWFTGGGASGSSMPMDPASPSFRYISLNVRAGRNAG